MKRLFFLCFLLVNPALARDSSSLKYKRTVAKAPTTMKGVFNRKQRTMRVRQVASLSGSVRPQSSMNVSGLAAPERKAGFELGFVGGMNLGYGVAEPTRSGATRNALSFSLLIDRPLGDGWSFAPELSFVQRGVQTDLYTFGTTTISGIIQMNTLEVPLLFRYKANLARKVSIFGMAGPYGSILLSRSIQVASVVEMDLSSRFGGFDAGMMAGVGLQVPIGRGASFISMLRYTYGLVNLDTTGNSFQTRGIQTLFGAQFGF